MKIVVDNFEVLRKSLENSVSNKDYILIIDYFINFLGCITLSALKNNLKEVSKDSKISDLMIGRWASYIEEWVLKYSTNRNLKSLLFIKEEFMQRKDESRLKGYVRTWIKLRSKLSHDTVLIDNERLTEINKRMLFQPKKSVDIFIDSLLKIIKYNENILNTDFFHFQDKTLYIYSGIDQESKIKYKHFNEEPISVTKSDFPLAYKEVFLTLSPTQSNILSGKDDIKIKMNTSHKKQYENDFALCANEREVMTIKKLFFNGDILTFPSSGFDFKDGENNLIEVKALRRGRVQASDKRDIKIYSKIPEPRIYWQGTEEKMIPIDKVSDIKLSIQSVFEINDIQVDVIESSDHIEILNEPTFMKTDTSIYSAIFNVQSTKLGETTIKATVSFTDRDVEKKNKDIDLHLICTPNFFEPAFEGEKRKKIINEMLSNRRNYLITGEGGIGKSRLIQEFINKDRIAKKIYDLTIIKGMTLRTLLIEKIKITIDKKAKVDEKIEKILCRFKEESTSGINRTFWIKDCHEIVKDEGRVLLKEIVDICSKPGSNIMPMLESRNETWSDNARKVIEEMKETDIRIIELDRFEEIELESVIDSIFRPNKFGLDLKKSLIQKSDGVIYILLQFLKHLYDKSFFILGDGEIWGAKTTDEFQNILNAINFNNVLKNNVEDSLNILDANGLGKKGRDMIRYLCFQDISYDVLRCVLELDSHSLQYILDIFEKDYVIKKQNDIFDFHHQLKKVLQA